MIEPLITLTPNYCEFTVEATIPTPLDTKLSFDATTQTFSLPQFFDSLELAGSLEGGSLSEKDHTIKVTFEAFSPY